MTPKVKYYYNISLDTAGAALELDDDELTARSTSEIRIKGKSIPVESELACSTITSGSTTGSAKEPAKEGDAEEMIAADIHCRLMQEATKSLPLVISP